MQQRFSLVSLGNLRSESVLCIPFILSGNPNESLLCAVHAQQQPGPGVRMPISA